MSWEDGIHLHTRKYAAENAGCFVFFFRWNDKKFCIDATEPSENLGRMINHSRKKPNVKPKVIGIDGVPHIYFVCCCEISVGDEVLWDYGETDRDVIKENPWIIDS